MHLRQFQHFLAVVDHGSLGSAARVAHISEPALSKSIRRLEEELGVKLFDRGTRGMEVNTFGESLAAHARVIVSELRYAVTEIEELRGLSKGVVRVGTQPSANIWLLPQAVRRLRRASPGVRCTVVDGTVDLVRRILAGDLDLIVVALAEAPPDLSLVQEPLCNYVATIVGAPNGALADGQAVGMEALAAADWVVPRRPDPLRLRFDAIFTARGLPPPEVTVETASPAMIRSMILDAGCLSFMPLDLFRSELGSGIMVRLTRAHDWQRQLGVIRRRRTALSPAARGLIRCLHEEAAEAGLTDG